MKETIGFIPKPREDEVEDIYRNSEGKLVRIGVRDMGIVEGLVKKAFHNDFIIDIGTGLVSVSYRDISMGKVSPLIIHPDSYRTKE